MHLAGSRRARSTWTHLSLRSNAGPPPDMASGPICLGRSLVVSTMYSPLDASPRGRSAAAPLTHLESCATLPYINNVPGLPPVCLPPRHTAHSFHETFYKQSPARAHSDWTHHPWGTSHASYLLLIGFLSALPSSSLQPGYNRGLAQTALLQSRSKRNECLTHPKENPNPKP